MSLLLKIETHAIHNGTSTMAVISACSPSPFTITKVWHIRYFALPSPNMPVTVFVCVELKPVEKAVFISRKDSHVI